MKRRIENFSLLVFLAAIGLGPSLTWAMEDNTKETAALSQVRITLSQAVNPALETVAGDAISAELNVSGKNPVYLVEVMERGQAHKISLDARNGKILIEKSGAVDGELTT